MSAEDPASAQQRGTTEHRDPSEEHTTNANTGLHGKTVIHHHYASQPKTEPPKRKNLLGWLTATFAAIAAIIYGVQAVIFQNQLTVAREQLVSSSRAFVVFAGLNAFAFNSQGDGLLKWNIAPIIENSGNTPTVGLKAK